MKTIRDEKLLKAFGARVRHLRLERGLTMEVLADQARIDYTQVARVEHGVSNTSISTASAIAKGLGVQLSELFTFGAESE